MGKADSSDRNQFTCSVQTLVAESLSSRYLVLTKVVHDQEQPGVHVTPPYPLFLLTMGTRAVSAGKTEVEAETTRSTGETLHSFQRFLSRVGQAVGTAIHLWR